MELPELDTEFQGKYRVLEVLGEGGFARVYLAEDVGAKRTVALKILKPIEGGYPRATESRFYREVKVIAKLRDPHTVTMFDFGKTEDGLLFMVFEYVPGTDLSHTIKDEGVLGPRATVHILQQVLRSLREAHQHGLLHRDLKPENIRVYEYMGDPLRVTLLDFGIAKPVKPGPEMSAITHAGALVGTPQYMSPEQLLEQELTPASDIYSLGLVAYEMLVGESAIAGNQLSDQLRILGSDQSLELPPSAPIPAGLRQVVNRMISREASMRMQTAEQVLRALDAVYIPDGQDLSLDETGALAPVNAPSHGRPITGPHPPPSTGPQPGVPSAVRPPSAEQRIPVTNPGSTASSHWSNASMRPGFAPNSAPSSTQVPLSGTHTPRPDSTIVSPDRLPTWALIGVAASFIGLVGFVVGVLVSSADETEQGTPKLPPSLNKVDPSPPPREPPNVPVQSPKAPTETAVAVDSADGCGIPLPDEKRGRISTIRASAGALELAAPLTVYVPKSYEPDKKYPLMVAFHDFMKGPTGIIKRSKLDALAEDHGVIIFAPRDKPAVPEGVWDSEDDVRRARREMETVLDAFCIDRGRIFGYGHGAGGRAASRLACEFHGISAAATTGFRPGRGSTPFCSGERVVPHLNVAALENKGERPCSGFGSEVMSIDAYEERLRKAGGCSTQRRVWDKHPLGTCYTWRCDIDRVSCHVRGGREFPGTTPRTDIMGVDFTECDGEPVNYPYTETIWRFFDEAVGQQGDQEPEEGE